MRGDRQDREELEVSLLLEGVYRHYGFDFRQYARASIRRRLWRRAYAEGLSTITGLLDRVLHDEEAMERLLLDLSINVTSMFRDPTFFATFRTKVVPFLRTFPFLRVWNAGCSTGEETYSLAILLHEVGLLERTRIYATDINEAVLRTAADGVFPLAKMKEYTENYLAAGGTRSFSEYYVSAYDRAQFNRSLAENVIFAQHNLVSDRSFNEFHVVVCRNVMIYFDRALQDRVHGLFLESLVPLGVLALGHKESVRHSAHADRYETLDEGERIYRRVR
ncbi:MAG: protein-glutamate O-methyltransferase CheR [Actinomycetota bacterium]|nr:protein-glutamate O-methyltransferase CheR [Actinomycetota bacterium]